ncbi:hypothetical protein K1719_024464 [Acacia pycnantha]|nr:hypothetical protein K1719_024464 [Acacia pycnantha]
MYPTDFHSGFGEGRFDGGWKEGDLQSSIWAKQRRISHGGISVEEFVKNFEEPNKPVLLEGYVFIDRDGKHFRHILNWLRDGAVPTLKDSEYTELLREAEYYQLLGLIDGIHAAINKRKENDELHTELTRTGFIKCGFQLCF